MGGSHIQTEKPASRHEDCSSTGWKDAPKGKERIQKTGKGAFLDPEYRTGDKGRVAHPLNHKRNREQPEHPAKGVGAWLCECDYDQE